MVPDRRPARFGAFRTVDFPQVRLKPALSCAKLSGIGNLAESSERCTERRMSWGQGRDLKRGGPSGVQGYRSSESSMPILAKDVDVSPPDLLSRAGTPVLDRRWYALYTKPRQEKMLLRRLQGGGKSYCGLLVPRRFRLPSGRLKTSFTPLFPGYVFLNGTDEDRYDAVCTDCVLQVLDVADGETLRMDLNRIYQAILSGREVTRIERLQRGQMVRIVSGPLSGHSGVLVAKKGKSRLVLSLSFIQQGAAVEIDDAVVEPA